MEGIWIKRCPRCGNYIRKIDPQEAGVCLKCGWKENETDLLPDKQS